MIPATRIEGLGSSKIRAATDGAPTDTLSLALGEPYWPLPEPAREALCKLGGPCRYGPNDGVAELRELLASRSAAQPEEVAVTVGAQGALAALFLAWLDPGDTVLVPNPGFPAYPSLARLAGAQPVDYVLRAENGFRLDPEAFRAALDGAPRAKLALLNHPANPTGAGAGREELAAVAALARSRDVLLVSDEVYRELPGADTVPSLRTVDPDAVVVSSLSKAWGSAGLRLGWMVGPREVVAPAGRVHAALNTAAAVPSQQAALALLRADAVVHRCAATALERSWSTFSRQWEACGAPPLRHPDGTFYLWLPLPRSEGGDDVTACQRLRDELGVATVPGSAFGSQGRGYLRLSFSASPEVLSQAAERLAPRWREDSRPGSAALSAPGTGPPAPGRAPSWRPGTA